MPEMLYPPWGRFCSLDGFVAAAPDATVLRDLQLPVIVVKRTSRYATGTKGDWTVNKAYRQVGEKVTPPHKVGNLHGTQFAGDTRIREKNAGGRD